MNNFELTDEQKDIVAFHGAPMRVLAGPGTGKTLCIIKKARFLIEKKKVPYNQICVITFTRATARELWERLLKEGIKTDSLPYVNTLHSLAMGILRNHLKRAKLKPGFRTVEGITQKILVKDVVQDLKEQNIILSPPDIRIFLRAHFQTKAKAGLPSHLSTNPHKEKVLREFSKCFHENLNFYNAVDWADVLHKTIELLDCYDDIRVEVHNRNQYLLVDEYQDLSPLEQFFVDKIIGNLNGLCIVGDDDQSIYETFRFADPSGIINFPKKYKDTESFFISFCRRCPPTVIQYALRLIRNNKKRVNKELKPFNKDKKGFVIFMRHKSKKKEIEWLVLKISELRKKDFEYKDIMVLFTGGDIAKDYVIALKKANIPLDVQLKVSNIFNSVYFIWLISTIRWLVNLDDNLSMRQCLDYWEGIGTETIRQLRFQALSTNSTLWEVMQNVSNNLNAFKKIKQRNKVKSFCDYLRKLKNFNKFQEIINQYFLAIPESKEDAGCKIFFEFLERFKDQEQVITIKEILEDFEQQVDSGELENKYKKERKNVQVMSMHSAKGCESRIVIIPALEDDIIPGINNNIEEQRRLFYVSITRAKYCVYLSWASQRSGQEIHKREGRRMLYKEKSRFLKEIEEAQI